MAVRTATAASHISGRSAGSSAASSGCARGLGARPASPSTTAARTLACDASNASSAAQHGTQSQAVACRLCSLAQKPPAVLLHIWHRQARIQSAASLLGAWHTGHFQQAQAQSDHHALASRCTKAAVVAAGMSSQKVSSTAQTPLIAATRTAGTSSPSAAPSTVNCRVSSSSVASCKGS